LSSSIANTPSLSFIITNLYYTNIVKKACKSKPGLVFILDY
jgi:hypothetical protein